ncbi:MAG TPA: amidase family protein, partial [Gammaproteobacteria bacterium]
ASVEAAFERWLAMLRGAGAELVDPIALRLPSEFRAAELEVLLHEFKAGIDRYLAAVEDGPRSLDALIAFNEEHAAEVMPFFGQDVFLMAQTRGGLDAPAYREALRAGRDLLRSRLERLFGTRQLDALVAPANAPAWTTDHARGDVVALSSSSIAAVSGYPSIVVPAGLVGGLPVGMALIGEPYREGRLVEIAAVFERLRGPMPAPAFLPTLGSEASRAAD